MGKAADRAKRTRQSEVDQAQTETLRRARLGPVLGVVFQELQMIAALTDGKTWKLISRWHNVVSFELAHGVEHRRGAHNVRAIAQVRRERRALLSPHAGFHDLYVPADPKAETLLVTGPFSIARPTSSEIQSRWRWLTGMQARATDPEFARYLEATLDTPLFDGPLLDSLLRFSETFCALLAGERDADSIAVEGASLAIKLGRVRFAERSFEAAATMVDERMSEAWTSSHWAEHLASLGATHLPSHAIVGLISGLADESDPIDQILRRDAFQRALVDSSRKIAGVVCGKVGDHGITLLVDHAGKGARVQAKLVDIAEHARALARRFALSLSTGISDPNSNAALPERYQAALAAAEKALTLGKPVLMADRAPLRVVSATGDLRRELAQAIRATPSLLGPRFDRYLEAVIARVGYRLEPVRAHLESGFDHVMDALRTIGAIDERSLLDLKEPLERAAHATTVPALLLAYRRAVLDVQEATLHPKEAQHDRSLRRATAFIREHSGEALPLKRVARVAGFAPTYFSSMFVRAEKTTLSRYIRKIRIERAEKLLESTTLGIERIGQVCGFHSRSSFHHAFQEIAGKTPGEFRAGAGRRDNITTRKR